MTMRLRVRVILFFMTSASVRALKVTSSLSAQHSDSALPAPTTQLLEEEPPSSLAFLTARGGSDVAHTAKVLFYFGLWYALNIVYNILNKKVLNVWPAPVTVGSWQLAVGSAYASLVWALKLRPMPSLQQKPLIRVGLWHSVGQLASMVSLGAGPVSFTHVVKALEPLFSALVSGILLGSWMHPVVYATLLPVVGGVVVACLGEAAFSWLALNAAMGSNVAFSLRAVLTKQFMQSNTNAIMSSTNVFAVVTIVAWLVSIPIALATDFSQSVPPNMIRKVIISGLFHYWNNEVMYLALSNVHPVTLAVGNTMKRVIILVASVMAFGNVITPLAGAGSAVAILGVLLYSLTRQYYETKEN